MIDVTESKWLRASVTGATAGSSEHTAYRVRVVPQDGQTEFESTLSTWGNFARYGKDIHDFWIHVVYDPEAPEKCELDKDWLHSLDLADWFAKESLRRHREQNPGRVPSAFPSQGIQAGGAPAGGTRSPDSDPAAYWRQYAEEQRAAFAPAAAGAAPAASQASPDERLAEIESLHNAGALTDDEYQAKRQQVIDSI